MRGIQVKEYLKGPQDMVVTTLPDLEPDSNLYLIQVEAAATNFFDLLQIRGKYQHQPPLPWVSGAEFSGTIKAVPTEPSSESGGRHKFKVGDRVFGSSQGAYATQIHAAEKSIRPIPKGWDFLDAAGLMVTAPTSYAGLVTRAGCKADDWVVVHAAAGGVGLAAVSIAKALGAKVIATAGSARKLEIAKQYGADHVIDYKENTNWHETVKDLTDGKGADIIYDPVGLINQSLKCAAWNSRLIVIGFAAGSIEKVAMNRVLLKNCSIVGLHWGMYAVMEPEAIEGVWNALYEMMEKGQFKSTVYKDKEYVGLEKVGEALHALGARDTWGKVVVKVSQDGASKL